MTKKYKHGFVQYQLGYLRVLNNTLVSPKCHLQMKHLSLSKFMRGI